MDFRLYSRIRNIAAIISLLCLAPAVSPRTLKETSNARLYPASSVVVAVQLDSPDFTLMELKYRVLYNKAEVKHIPLTDYDFKVAFTDELMTALTEDKRMNWRKQNSGEVIDVPALWNHKVQPPNVEADRILLVQIQGYGAFVASLAADKFFLQARFRLIDRASNKKLWEKKMYERVDLNGKISELQADNQKGLKEGINKVLEKLCGKIASEIRGASL